MPYSYQIYSSVEEVDPLEWDAVQQSSASPLTDLRMLRVFDRTLQDQAQVWPLLIRDQEGRPAAVSCLSLFRVDGAILAGPIIRMVADRMRRIRPQFLRLPLLIGGVPVATGGPAIAIREDADSDAVTRALADALEQMRQRLRPKISLVNEFTDEQADALAGLEAAGFLRVPSLPMNEFPPGCSDFDEYIEQQTSRERNKIRRTRKKLAKGGITVRHLQGEEAIAQLTDDVYRLYEGVYEKSETKFEHLPLEFFRELARQLPEEIRYTFFLRDERAVAYSTQIAYRGRVYFLWLGVDYDLVREYDLYFNVLYEDLETALKLQPQLIYFGQNASHVKLRLGCRQSARRLFVKGHGLFGPLLRRFSPYIFREVPVQSGDVEEQVEPPKVLQRA
jgi:predicted N-acyltransferase